MPKSNIKLPMKKLLLPVLALGLILLVSNSHQVKAEPRHLPGAVVFAAQQYYEGGFPKSYIVYIVSQGKNAPLVLPGTELATVIENLLASGFEVKELPGLQFMAIRK